MTECGIEEDVRQHNTCMGNFFFMPNGRRSAAARMHSIVALCLKNIRVIPHLIVLSEIASFREVFS